MNYNPGDIIGGKYRIISTLGGGSMGTVYSAENINMSKPVAIKVLHADVAQKLEYRQRFMREARSAASLEHSNICTIMDFDSTEDGDAYIVMEMLTGEVLTKRMERVGAFTPFAAVRVIRQLVGALSCAHQGGVVHRDVKPDNIFLIQREGVDDFVKLIDFGIAHIEMHEGDLKTLTKAGQIYGTPKYISPEQALGDPVDYRADLYAVGVIFYELLVGRAPFVGKNYIDLLNKQVNEPAPHLPATFPQAQKFDEIIQKLLEKDPDNRYSSALEILPILDELLIMLSSDDPISSISQVLSRSMSLDMPAMDEATISSENKIISGLSAIINAPLTPVSSNNPPPCNTHVSGDNPVVSKSSEPKRSRISDPKTSGAIIPEINPDEDDDEAEIAATNKQARKLIITLVVVIIVLAILVGWLFASQRLSPLPPSAAQQTNNSNSTDGPPKTASDTQIPNAQAANSDDNPPPAHADQNPGSGIAPDATPNQNVQPPEKSEKPIPQPFNTEVSDFKISYDELLSHENEVVSAVENYYGKDYKKALSNLNTVKEAYWDHPNFLRLYLMTNRQLKQYADVYVTLAHLFAIEPNASQNSAVRTVAYDYFANATLGDALLEALTTEQSPSTALNVAWLVILSAYDVNSLRRTKMVAAFDALPHDDVPEWLVKSIDIWRLDRTNCNERRRQLSKLAELNSPEIFQNVIIPMSNKRERNCSEKGRFNRIVPKDCNDCARTLLRDLVTKYGKNNDTVPSQAVIEVNDSQNIDDENDASSNEIDFDLTDI